MTSYGASIQLVDKMTPILDNIITALNMTISTVYDVQSSVDGFDASGFDAIRETIAQAESEMQKIQNQISENTSEQKKFNDSVKQGTNAAGELENSVRDIASAYGLYKIADIIQDGAQELINLSDDMTSNEARLKLIVDEDSLEDAKAKIFAAAQDTRSDYSEMMSSAVSLGLNSGDVFSDPTGNINYDEIVAFQELLNKNFIIGGASSSEQASAMYQLMQAMSSGRLQGDEYRSIIENAPLLAKSIEEYMVNAGVKGTLKEWASEGLLTADVIKNAVFNSADEVEDQFETIPMTWAQIATKCENQAKRMFDPVLDQINALANDEEFVNVVNGIMSGLERIVPVVSNIIDSAANGVIWIAENWDQISPVLLGIAGALGFVAAAQLANATATAIANAAWLSSPITWIAFAIFTIIIIIYEVIEAVNKATESTTSAMGAILGAISFTAALIFNTVIGLINSLLQFVWYAFVNPFVNIIEWILNVCTGGFDSFGGAVASIIGNIISNIFSMAKIITPIIDAVFGTNWTSGLTSLQEEVLAWGKTEDAITISREAPYIDYRLDMTDSFDLGYSLGEKTENTDITEMFESLVDNTLGIGEDASNINDTISASSDEELEWLRKITERDAVNKFTTAEIKLDFSSTATLNSDMDIDGYINTFTTGLQEALVTTAEGLEK